MAKFPILEWKEIDGIDTPFTYPQHEKKDGSFVVTGENDPLPVAGYGMTDNGIWIPKRVNDDGSVNTQLTGSIVADKYLAVKEIIADPGTTLITPDGINTVEIKPPAGYIWKTPLIWALMPKPIEPSSGTTQIELKHGVDHYRYIVLRARSNADSMTRIMANTAETSTHSQLPEDKITQQNAIQNIILSNDKPLYVSYWNMTDVEYNQRLELRLIVTEERVSS